MRVLHFNPEPALQPLLRGRVQSYVTSGRRRDPDDAGLDIESIALADHSLDLIIAHQSLEVGDHHKALAECFRCLEPGGRLVTAAPVVETWATTYENPAITSPRDRQLHFGQRDHTRYFGRDLRDHMRAAGFDLGEFVAVEPDVANHGLIRGETLFILTRPPTPARRATKAKTRKG